MKHKKIKKQKKEPVFIDILSDFGFKRVFADENNKDLLISLLNAILGKINVQISSIQFTQIEQLPEEEDDRKVVLDLHCLNEKGENIIIEIQNQDYNYFIDRLIFYAARIISNQQPKGNINGKKWNFDFKAVYIISINRNKKGELLNTYCLVNTQNQQVISNKINIIEINLANPIEKRRILDGLFEKWLYLLRELKNLEEIPDEFRMQAFTKLFSITQYLGLNKKDKEIYNKSVDNMGVWQNALDFAKNEGFNEAQEIIAQLTQEKLKAEEEKLKAEEEKLKAEEEKLKAEEELKSIVKTMKAEGLTDSLIAKITGLSLDEINQL